METLKLLEILTKFSKLEKHQKVNLTENELYLCIKYISSTKTEDIPLFWVLLINVLENESMNIVRESCTPYLVKSVYGF